MQIAVRSASLMFLICSTTAFAQAPPPPFTLINYRLSLSEPLGSLYNFAGTYQATSAASVGQNGLSGSANVRAFSVIGNVGSAAAGSGPGYYSLAGASWSDRILVDAGALNGTTGSLTFQISYNWLLNVSSNGPANASASASIILGDYITGVSQQRLTSCSVANSCGTSLGTVNVQADPGTSASIAGTSTLNSAQGILTSTIPIVLGQQTDLIVGISSIARYSDTRFVGNSSASVQADQTVTWNGIRSVNDANGNPIAVYDAISASGFEYEQPYAPVPESSTLAMFLAGLAIVIGCSNNILARK